MLYAHAVRAHQLDGIEAHFLDALGAGADCGGPRPLTASSANTPTRQHDSMRQMILGIDELLNFVDARVELRPGDLIFTGSTRGVSLEDGRFLKRSGLLRNTIGPKTSAEPVARHRAARHWWHLLS
ncbi:fumarylacetoacetate hydrolase family protein [Roseateles sp. GG27B]